MKSALPTYLHDHLAGAVFGVELVEALEDDHGEAELGQLARIWKAEILADRATLRDVADRLGAESSPVKEMIGWIAERATRLKLRRQNQRELGTFETLETLALGIMGKAKLWQALQIAAETDARLAGIDFMRLEQRAIAQHDAVETYRRRLASVVFAPTATGER